MVKLHTPDATEYIRINGRPLVICSVRVILGRRHKDGASTALQQPPPYQLIQLSAHQHAGVVKLADARDSKRFV